MQPKRLLIKQNNTWKFIFIDFSKLEFKNNKIPSETLLLTEVVYEDEIFIVPHVNLQLIKDVKDGKPIQEQYYYKIW